MRAVGARVQHWRRRPSRADKRAWRPTGRYTVGCSDDFKGDELVESARGQVVVVTLNYRLNVFGFLGGVGLAGMPAAAASLVRWG